MSSNPINYLRQVQVYAESALGALTNQNCLIGKIANKEFENFQNETHNLGDTITYEKPYRYVGGPGLDVTFESTTQRYETLTCDKSQHVAPAFTDQQFTFNADQYMKKIGMGAVAQLGAKTEADANSGILDTAYRFYGDGRTAIDSYEQLAQGIAYNDEYGSVYTDRCAVIPTLNVPAIVADGLNQFALDRNNRIANTWELGNWGSYDWYRSNLLPTHIAGTLGDANDILTFVSINDAGDQITFSGAGTDATALRKNDLLYFTTNVRYLTFTGYIPCGAPVQVRITADAASSGGTVVASIYPALRADTEAGIDRNLSRALTTSDTAKLAASHRRGYLVTGNSMYLAMPKLNEKVPYPSAQVMDDKTGVALRMYYGTEFGKNTMALIHDLIYGYRFTPEYAFAFLFPL